MQQSQAWSTGKVAQIVRNAYVCRKIINSKIAWPPPFKNIDVAKATKIGGFSPARYLAKFQSQFWLSRQAFRMPSCRPHTVLDGFGLERCSFPSFLLGGFWLSPALGGSACRLPPKTGVDNENLKTGGKLTVCLPNCVWQSRQLSQVLCSPCIAWDRGPFPKGFFLEHKYLAREPHRDGCTQTKWNPAPIRKASSGTIEHCGLVKINFA